MERNDPRIIQGGMGVAVSHWRLARAVSRMGQLGVVSGTGLDVVLARRLQLGDLNGTFRRAIAEFPDQRIAERVLQAHFVAGGRNTDAPYAPAPPHAPRMSRDATELLMVANFVEVFLAKEEHHGQVGINYMEKIQLPFLPALFGAMLAKVDYVLVGAGIPQHVPEVLDRMSDGKKVELDLRVEGARDGERFVSTFDPARAISLGTPWLTRPRFLAIVSSATLARRLVSKERGRVDGFVVEGPSAGGHNAPPRGPKRHNHRGEPIYGPRDEVDLGVFRDLERPFWLAGSHGSADRLERAREAGAVGVQVGTPFAFCEESGLTASVKRRVLRMVREGKADVLTDARASPTGFPFKVLSLRGTLSDAESWAARRRICDVGCLRQAYRKEDGTLGWRCPAEAAATYMKKGGSLEETLGRKCLCNALLANVGLGQVRAGSDIEPMLLTAGDEVRNLLRYLPHANADLFTAKDVVRTILSGVHVP